MVGKRNKLKKKKKTVLQNKHLVIFIFGLKYFLLVILY